MTRLRFQGKGADAVASGRMARRQKKARTARVPAAERRRQLIAEASRILGEEGLEKLQISALAERAGVSRPLVYRQFPTRQALTRAILEDFTSAIDARFHQALLRTLPAADLESVTTAFVEACCDVIEDKGAGPWLLLDARGSDPEVARVGRETFSGLLGPWQDQLRTFTGTDARRAANDLWIIVAAGRAALGGWIDGTLERPEAVADATRAVTALLAAFQNRGR